jgi:hypothetical protein
MATLNTLTLLGDGANGCVYTGIECTNDEILKLNLGENYVTKVIDVTTGKNETTAYTKLNELISSLSSADKKKFENYFISGLEECNVTNKMGLIQKLINENKQNLKKNCKPINDGKIQADNLMVLSQPNGGIMNLYDYKTILSTLSVENDVSDYLPNMFIALLDLFKAVDLLNRNNIYLFDLKSPNVTVLLNPDDGSIRAVKIVDLASIKKVDITDARKYEHVNVLVKDDDKTVNVQGTLAYYAPEMIHLFNDGTPILLGKYIYFDFTLESDKYVLKSKNNNAIKDTISQTEYSKYHQNPRKNDVWALGVIMLEIYNALLYVIKNNDQYEGYEEHKKKIRDINESLLEQVIKPILVLNFEDRPDSKIALDNYKKWIEEYFGYNEDASHTRSRSRSPSPSPSPSPHSRSHSPSRELSPTPPPTPGGGRHLKKKSRKQTKKIYRKLKTHKNKTRKSKRQTRRRRQPKH